MLSVTLRRPCLLERRFRPRHRIVRQHLLPRSVRFLPPLSSLLGAVRLLVLMAERRGALAKTFIAGRFGRFRTRTWLVECLGMARPSGYVLVRLKSGQTS